MSLFCTRSSLTSEAKPSLEIRPSTERTHCVRVMKMIFHYTETIDPYTRTEVDLYILKCIFIDHIKIILKQKLNLKQKKEVKNTLKTQELDKYIK